MFARAAQNNEKKYRRRMERSRCTQSSACAVLSSRCFYIWHVCLCSFGLRINEPGRSAFYSARLAFGRMMVRALRPFSDVISLGFDWIREVERAAWRSLSQNAIIIMARPQRKGTHFGLVLIGRAHPNSMRSRRERARSTRALDAMLVRDLANGNLFVSLRSTWSRLIRGFSFGGRTDNIVYTDGHINMNISLFREECCQPTTFHLNAFDK